MDANVFMQAVSTVGFPIACCCILFYQNDKLRQTIDSLKDTLTENTTLLKMLSAKMESEDN